MARTAADIEAKIAELRAAQKKTQARNGWRHYEERISYLNGELMLQREKERQEEEAPMLDGDDYERAEAHYTR